MASLSAREVVTTTSAQTIKMSFSGSDADVFVYVPGYGGSTGLQTGSKLIQLESIQTISVSVFRDKVPVRALGYTNVKGHARGQRSIAGSLIFAVLNDHPLWELAKNYDYEWSFDRYISAASDASTGRTIFSDIIPPFNIVIYYNNELGNAAILELIGVDITNDGLVTSIEDLLTEKTMQYRARDMREFQAITGANGLSTRDGAFPPTDFNEVSTSSTKNFNTSISLPLSDGRSLAHKLRCINK